MEFIENGYEAGEFARMGGITRRVKAALGRIERYRTKPVATSTDKAEKTKAGNTRFVVEYRIGGVWRPRHEWLKKAGVPGTSVFGISAIKSRVTRDMEEWGAPAPKKKGIDADAVRAKLAALGLRPEEIAAILGGAA